MGGSVRPCPFTLVRTSVLDFFLLLFLICLRTRVGERKEELTQVKRSVTFLFLQDGDME